MIRKIWVRIAVVLAIAIIPITFLQFKLESDAINLVFGMASETGIRGTMDGILVFMRDQARQFPNQEAEMIQRFNKTMETKRAIEEFFLVQSSVLHEIWVQTISMTLGVMGFCLLLSFGVARGIVRKVESLLKEKETTAARLREVAVLENWQTLARTLVHELRAPITPIKLVATDIEFKYESMSPEAYSQYLKTSQALVREQVQTIETMIQGFMAFGRLPPPVKASTCWHEFIEDFVAIYGLSWGPEVHVSQKYNGDLKANILVDQKLLRDLLFNLCKNAAEANQGKTDICLASSFVGNSLQVLIQNSGKPIAPQVRTTLFEPYVSTHSGNGGNNLGLGLTISRKIALDHQGELRLGPHQNEGVTFILELPLTPSN